MMRLHHLGPRSRPKNCGIEAPGSSGRLRRMSLTIGSQLGRYTILASLGAGGMGEVYRARDTRLGRDVALKLLPADVAHDEERRRRFEREARAVASLTHPNIVTLHSVEEADGRVFLTMELVEGKTISELLPSGGFPLSRFFHLAIPLAEAVHGAHAAGITHRDLKPANVMVDAEGRVKVLDFGLAKLLDRTDDEVAEAETVLDDSPDTAAGTVLGTVAYMSPEQAEGKPVDARSDIFSLGVLLYEMATGRQPFHGETSLSRLSSVLKDTPTSVTAIRSELPNQLGRIIQHCLEKDPRRRLQSALDVANMLESLQVEVGSSTGSVGAVGPGRPRVDARVGIGALVAVAALAAFLILDPWKLRVTPEPGAGADTNTLAIMYFENLAEPEDPKRHGEIVSELLITGLSEAANMRVVSSQRLYDVLKQLGREGERRIDRDTATDVARRTDARLMMQGTILQAEPAYVVTSQIVEVATGNVVASQRTTGVPGESIFVLVDRITEETLDDLGGTEESAAETTPSVASLSTNSEDAYRFYLEGIENERKFFNQEARDAYLQALAIDSTFAMAAYRLGGLGGSRGDRKYLAQAVRHADRASTREQMYLEGAEAWLASDPDRFIASLERVLETYPDDKHALEGLRQAYGILGPPEKAIEYAERLLALDPLDKTVHNELAYAYSAVGDLDRAIHELDTYIELAPDEPNPYDSRGDIFARHGRLEEAIASYAKAVEMKPDFADYQSAAKLGDMYAFHGDYEKAESQFRHLFASPDAETRARGRTGLIGLLAYRGRVEEALRQIDAALTVDQMEGVHSQTMAARHEQRGFLLQEIGDRSGAVAAVHRALEIAPPENDFDLIDAASVLARVGAVEESHRYLEPYIAREDSSTSVLQAYYYVARGNLEMTRGELDLAISYLERAQSANWIWTRLPLGRCYVETRQWEKAIGLLETTVTWYDGDRLQCGLDSARAYYHLGICYQNVGRPEDAVAQLVQFLSIVDGGDPRIAEIEDARRRLRDLRTG